MKNFLKIILVSPLFWAISCSSDDTGGREIPNAKSIVLKPEFEKKMDTNNLFAIDLFRSTVEHSVGNVLVSPLSVNMVLNMAWNGADGVTGSEMQQMLGNEGYTLDQINEYSKSLREALLSVDPSTELSIANSVWVAKNFSLKESFIKVNQDNYDAVVKEVDFSSPSALQEINTWCSERTKGKIPEVLDELSLYTKLALVNALYFKGQWRERFDVKSTIDEPFTNENGENSTVKMMAQESHYSYAENENWRCVSLPYGNKAFSMLVLLPNNEKNLSDVLPTLTADSWNGIVKMLSTRKILLKLPRFKAEYAYEMSKAILPAMGMKQAFDPDKANFSKICLGPLYISQVVHKTFVEVNEEGTEAAATTVASWELTSVGPESAIDFFVDQPFVYAICENSTGTILFIGMVVSL